MDKIKIQEIVLSIFGKIDAVTIKIMGFSVSATNCEICCEFYYQDKYVATKYIAMPQSVFENWGYDNIYIKEWVLNELGLIENQ